MLRSLLILAFLTTAAHAGPMVFSVGLIVDDYHKLESQVVYLETPSGRLEHDFGEPFECDSAPVSPNTCNHLIVTWLPGEPNVDAVIADLYAHEPVTVGWGEMTAGIPINLPPGVELERLRFRPRVAIITEEFDNSSVLAYWQGYATPEPASMWLLLTPAGYALPWRSRRKGVRWVAVSVHAGQNGDC